MINSGNYINTKIQNTLSTNIEANYIKQYQQSLIPKSNNKHYVAITKAIIDMSGVGMFSASLLDNMYITMKAGASEKQVALQFIPQTSWEDKYIFVIEQVINSMNNAIVSACGTLGLTDIPKIEYDKLNERFKITFTASYYAIDNSGTNKLYVNMNLYNLLYGFNVIYNEATPSKIYQILCDNTSYIVYSGKINLRNWYQWDAVCITTNMGTNPEYIDTIQEKKQYSDIKILQKIDFMDLSGDFINVMTYNPIYLKWIELTDNNLSRIDYKIMLLNKYTDQLVPVSLLPNNKVNITFQFI